MEIILEEWMSKYGRPISDEKNESKFPEEMKRKLSDLGCLGDSCV